MAGSVGTVKIPIVSTFDPAGIVAAKAGMRELSQTKTGGGGGGGSGGGGEITAKRLSGQDEAQKVFESTRTANEKYESQIRKLDDLHKRGAISTETFHRAQKQAAEQLPQQKSIASRLGIGKAGETLADQAGLGGVTSAFGSMGTAGIVAGAAVAGVAIYGLTQKVASEAVALKEHARQLNVSTTYYSGLTSAANKAGVSVETVTEGLTGLHGMAASALTGDIGTAMFFRSMGISRMDLEAGYEDTEGLSRRVLSSARTPGQRATIFGSVAAANAIQTANDDPSKYATTAGEAQAAASAAAGVTNYGVHVFGRAVQDFRSTFLGAGSYEEQNAKAAEDERKEREGKLQAARTKVGMQAVPGLLSPQELAEERTAQAKDIFKEAGADRSRFERLHAAQISEQRTSAEAPLMRPRELADRQFADWKAKFTAGGENSSGGYSSPKQATEAGIQIYERLNQSLAGVRSNTENLSATLSTSDARWKNSDSPGEKRDLSRSLGDSFTEYAESITRSGALAGAYDANSAAGYSQQVGAEYAMDQSKDTVRMVELLVKIAENTGKMSKEQGDAVLENLGFRTADPIFGGGD